MLPDQARGPQDKRNLAASAKSNELDSLAGFWKLPNELQQRIVALACGPPTLHRHTVVARSTDCTTTMISLLRTARGFYAMTLPLLYAHVRLSRPSMLREFQSTLSILLSMENGEVD